MPRSKAAGTAAALFYIFLWASAYVPSKIGVLDSSPLWFLVARFLVSGILALALARALGGALPRTRAEGLAVFALGVLNNGIYLGLSYEALRHLAAGVGAIIASTNPLLLALVAPFALREPLTPSKVAGLVLGFGGVLWIMLARTGSGTADFRDVLLGIGGVVGSVAGTIVFKRWCGGIDLRMTAALQLLAAGVALVPFAGLLEGAPHAQWSARLIVSYWYLVAVISVGASMLWFWLLTHGEASRVTAFYFLTPVFGLALSFVLLHEPVGVRDLGGLAAIVLGIVLVQRA